MAHTECMHGQTIRRSDNGVITYWCPRCATTFAEDPYKVVDRELVSLAAAAGVLVVSTPPDPARFGKKQKKGKNGRRLHAV